MANSNTEHSRKLRNKTSALAQEKRIKSGTHKIFKVMLTTEIHQIVYQHYKESGKTWDQFFYDLFTQETNR
ncbi:hypothetical protein PT286_05045 [Neisseriaceae bacterium ESL0693]|nr:hypothetical protein [Neisseriaceae bacterium ESL0693]